MKQVLTRFVSVPVQKLCHIQWGVRVEPFSDPHFRPEPSYILENKYFETFEEAQAFLKENEAYRKAGGDRLSVVQKITELE